MPCNFLQKVNTNNLDISAMISTKRSGNASLDAADNHRKSLGASASAASSAAALDEDEDDEDDSDYNPESGEQIP
jgi:hypothetical protein